MTILLYIIAILGGVVAALWVVILLQALNVVGPIPVP